MILLLTIILGALFITLLVTLHEFGHFFTAKFFKVKVKEFGIGFPPRLWGKKKGETIYSVNALPAGGFVRLYGEEGEGIGDPRSFVSKGPWVRATIIVAGVVVNLILAFILFSFLLISSNFRVDIPLGIPTSGQELDIKFPFGTQTDKVFILFVRPESPAEKAGLKQLDEITSANGMALSKIEEAQEYIKEHAGEEIRFELYNILDRETRVAVATPRVDPPEDEGALGVALDKAATLRYESLGEKILVGPLHSVNMLYYQGNAMGSLISQSFKEGTVAPVSETVSGPVGIVALLGAFIGATGTKGIWALVETVALLSLILAFINVLPIPALDGGRLFFSVFEGVTGKKVNPTVERLVHTAGFMFIIALFLLITYNDIIKIFR
jgi:regulator of sigma E protease